MPKAPMRKSITLIKRVATVSEDTVSSDKVIDEITGLSVSRDEYEARKADREATLEANNNMLIEATKQDIAALLNDLRYESEVLAVKPNGLCKLRELRFNIETLARSLAKEKANVNVAI